MSLSQSGIESLWLEEDPLERHPAKDMVKTIRAAQVTLPLRCMTNARALHWVSISVLRFLDMKDSGIKIDTNRMLELIGVGLKGCIDPCAIRCVEL